MKLLSDIRIRGREFAKKIIYRKTRWGAPSYPFGVEPIMLSRVMQHIEKITVDSVNIVEAGVARGMTTRFLLQHLKVLGRKNAYYAIDTFEGFVSSHVDHERASRGKNPNEMRHFEYNDYDVWKGHLARFEQLKAVKSDISIFDFSKIKPVEIFVLDVDLYIPTARALENVWDNMSPTGCIYMDDVKPNNVWDGSLQAFEEFVSKTGARCERLGDKTGLIYKN
jgi:hypothetical protein